MPVLSFPSEETAVALVLVRVSRPGLGFEADQLVWVRKDWWIEAQELVMLTDWHRFDLLSYLSWPGTSSAQVRNILYVCVDDWCGHMF